MKRFDCPSCARPLGFRLLPHVPRPDGQIWFSCTHCGAVLTYSDAHIPLGKSLWGTRLRSLSTFLGGVVLLWGIELAVGRVAALTALLVVFVIYCTVFFLSPKPAYEVVNREPPGDRAQPSTASRNA